MYVLTWMYVLLFENVHIGGGNEIKWRQLELRICNKGIKCISIWVYFTLKRCINLFTFMPVKNGSVFSWFMTLNLPKSKMLLCVCHCAIITIIYPSGCQDTGCYWLGTLEMQSGVMFFFQVFQVYALQGNKSISSA